MIMITLEKGLYMCVRFEDNAEAQWWVWRLPCKEPSCIVIFTGGGGDDDEIMMILMMKLMYVCVCVIVIVITIVTITSHPSRHHPTPYPDSQPFLPLSPLTLQAPPYSAPPSPPMLQSTLNTNPLSPPLPPYAPSHTKNKITNNKPIFFLSKPQHYLKIYGFPGLNQQPTQWRANYKPSITIWPPTYCLHTHTQNYWVFDHQRINPIHHSPFGSDFSKLFSIPSLTFFMWFLGDVFLV